MVSGRTKRIVVIKDIPSNIIEEAILILKSDPDSKEDQNSQQPVKGKNKQEQDFLIKEAESIINNYIKENKTQAALRREAELKTGFFKKAFSSTNLVINLVLVGSVVLLLILIAKMA